MHNTFRSLKQSGVKGLERLERAWKENRGQDLIEYALMAGLVATTATAIVPGVGTSLSQIYSKVTSLIVQAASQGS